MSDVANILDHLRDGPDEPLAWLANRTRRPISAECRATLDRLATVLDGYDVDSPHWCLLSELLLDRSRIAARIVEATSIGGRSQGIAIWRLLNFPRIQPPGSGRAILRLLERIRRRVAIGNHSDLRQLPDSA